MNHNHANRLFLLSLIAPLGCDPEPEPSTTGAATTVGGTGGGMSTSGGEADTAADDGDSTAGADSADDTGGDTAAGDTAAGDTMGGDTAADTAADTGADTGTTGGEPACEEPPVIQGEISQVCVEYATWTADCYFEGSFPPECIGYYDTYCQSVLEEYEAGDGAACRAAIEDVFACINGLTCREFSEAEEPCPEESMALSIACPNAGG
ncbi:MAG: hypothetical protein AAF721_11425 [Myxococcota bacterium]